MKIVSPGYRAALQVALVAFCCLSVAQAQPGHGGMPPGQAKKYGDDGMPPGQAKKYGEDGRSMPPGQAKKYGDWRFREDDRDRFYSHYRDDAERWRGRRRPVFVPGEFIPRTYVVHVVPQSYWAGVPPPPPGYQYGYYDGYVVAYNPATRVIGDVLDLIGAATGR
ncbi:MAG: hypothetical protein NVSMB62_06050 [Acidobacteriaceae bacterium]